MLRSLGYELDELAATANILFVVRSVQVDYLKPARFNQQLAVSAKIATSSKTSLTFEQTISHGDTVLCTSLIRIACVDASSLRPKAIPDYLLEQLT
jgi:Predicted thioesterase